MAFPGDLAPSSFRGVSFLAPHDADQGGVNCVQHHFPGSRVHYVQPNGVYQGEFHLKCVLHGPGLAGKFNAFQAALDTPAPGTLRHPWLGPKICIAKHPWKVVRDDRDLGVLEVEVTFLETGPAKFPSIVSGIAASISGLSSTAITISFANLTASFALPGLPMSQAYVGGVMAGLANTLQGQFPQVGNLATAAAAVRTAALPIMR